MAKLLEQPAMDSFTPAFDGDLLVSVCQPAQSPQTGCLLSALARETSCLPGVHWTGQGCQSAC